jgi:hypothetical protein
MTGLVGHLESPTSASMTHETSEQSDRLLEASSRDVANDDVEEVKLTEDQDDDDDDDIVGHNMS